MNFIYFQSIAVIVFIITARINAEQRFAETPALYQEVSSGDDVQLRCRVQDKRGQCIWQKDRKPVGMHPDKYEWASGRGSDCTLLIRRASLDFDDGYWECQVTSGDFTRQDALTSLPSRLLVRDSPEVRLETKPRLLVSALEDSASFMSLKCFADGNPSGTIKWFKDSAPIAVTSNIVTLMLNRTQQNGTMTGSELRFEPVKRNDAGLYSCKAVNIIGESTAANYRLDVQYGPRLNSEDPHNNNTIKKFEETTLLGTSLEPFECTDFEANPPAQYRWMHLRGGVTETIENSLQPKNGGKRLRLENVMWSDEGEYRCVAFNVINGVRREMPSEARYLLHVTGPPEIQARPSSGGKGIYESLGWAGEPEHILKSRFCSRPPPRLVAWQWGSSHIRAGENIHPKYEALSLEHIKENEIPTNCYWAKLVIKDLQTEDARIYTLLVESEKGRDSTNIKLIIRDPTEMRVIAAAAAVGLLFLLLLISIAVYSVLRLKSRQYRQEEEEGSIAADAFYSNTPTTDRQKNINLSQNKEYTRKTNTEGGLAVTYDYDQITKQVRAISPEALKVRRAPAVLQPPTIV
ncbi:hemicentin-2 [Apis mellifera caucasica]|nr:hemicentin-2 [Apis mellifera caucasica]